MIRYKLARIVDGRYLSANRMEREPNGDNCFEYEVGKVTSARHYGIACYREREYAITPHNIDETRGYFNEGKPIALLKVKSMGRHLKDPFGQCAEGMMYEGGINYRSVEVLGATVIEGG